MRPPTTYRAIRFHETGGPEVLRVDEIAAAPLGPGEVRIRLAYAGVNFIDVYNRTGLYPPGELPARLGREGAGRVVEVGVEVDGIRVGDRVAFFDGLGSYAELVTHPADRVLAVPGNVSDEHAAALPLQGMTADYLVNTIGAVAAGDVVLVHAAAGGVGRIAVQMAKAAGATVYGTCSTRTKAAVVRGAGADDAILYTEVDFAEEILRRTAGRGADLVLDSVGRATFAGSVRATRTRGTLVLFGQSSGMIEPFSPRTVLGSRTLVTATLFAYAAEPAELAERWRRTVDGLAAGVFTLSIDSTFPLAEAAEAHRRLESRASSGKILLDVR